ncbi:MAG: hypothetical protein MJB14_12260 [Spirochaetes bacterium]|nr:hypothetical protein [Spirochaetota bacterium]
MPIYGQHPRESDMPTKTIVSLRQVYNKFFWLAIVLLSISTFFFVQYFLKKNTLIKQGVKTYATVERQGQSNYRYRDPILVYFKYTFNVDGIEYRNSDLLGIYPANCSIEEDKWNTILSRNKKVEVVFDPANPKRNDLAIALLIKPNTGVIVILGTIITALICFYIYLNFIKKKS